jgi:hypothetical protein
LVIILLIDQFSGVDFDDLDPLINLKVKPNAQNLGPTPNVCNVSLIKENPNAQNKHYPSDTLNSICVYSILIDVFRMALRPKIIVHSHFDLINVKLLL